MLSVVDSLKQILSFVLLLQGYPVNIKDLKVLLDKRVYRDLEGQWRDLFNRLKWDTVKSALKSVAGLQGRKFKVRKQDCSILTTNYPLRVSFTPKLAYVYLVQNEACGEPAVVWQAISLAEKFSKSCNGQNFKVSLVSVAGADAEQGGGRQ